MSRTLFTFNRLAIGKRKASDIVEAIADGNHYRDEAAAEEAGKALSHRAVTEALFVYREALRRSEWYTRRLAHELRDDDSSLSWKPNRPARRSALAR